MQLTLSEYLAGVQERRFSPREVVAHYLDKAQKQDTYNAYLRTHPDYIEKHIEQLAQRELAAAPIAIKDIILTKGYTTTCASAILDGYVPPYSATCFERLEQAGGAMLGKTNMDEFAMGGSNEHSAYGPVRNPHDHDRIPGGSSGGSAAAVAADLCIAALGTDTGGSVRQPAAMCGVVGIKPTYGRVSRYGVQAMASSLDQVGVIAKTVEDSCILLDQIAAGDDRDATSVERDDHQQRYQALQWEGLTDKKIALPKEFFGEGLDDQIKQTVLKAVEKMEALGAQVEWVDLPILEQGIAAYYVIMPAEASTNLARFDGVRYGKQTDTYEYDDIHAYYAQIRGEGFGEEVERRILLGTYVLSAGHYDAYYHTAQKVRAKIKMELDDLYQTYDIIVGPTTPTLPRKIGSHTDDPVAEYLSDMYSVIANLTGMPSLSLPVGRADHDSSRLPVGLQLIGQQWREDLLFGTAHQLERTLDVANFSGSMHN